jgi:hypothetical protein
VPASLCPECAREALVNRSTRRDTRELPHPLQIGETATMRDTYAEYVARKREAGAVLPGSADESIALERIDDEREAERERDTRSIGQFVTQRIEDCQLVQYYAKRGPRGRTQFVRVVV